MYHSTYRSFVAFRRHFDCLRLTALFTAALFSATAATAAEEPATGTVTGRVLNATNGAYLSKARVTVEGTDIEAFTDDTGEYVLRNVPVGDARLKVFYTGQSPVTQTAVVKPSETTAKNIAFNSSSDSSNGTLMLNEYVVESRRLRTATELANNEERNSVNIKNVVATDSLGYVADGNIGNFVQFLPGVDIGYGGTYASPNDPSSISVRGFGPEDTLVMVDGMSVGSPTPGTLTRAVGLDMLSINNASRIEIIKVATPDMPTTSPGGAVNLVTRSAFEFKNRSIRFDLTGSMNTLDTRVFKKSPGPANEKTYHTMPSARLSVSLPLSPRLGVSLSLASDNKFAVDRGLSSSWIFAPANGGPTGTPLTNKFGTISYRNPYLREVSVTDRPFISFKQSGNVRVDWRPIPALLLNSNVQYSRYDSTNAARRIQIRVGQPADWGPDFVRGHQRTSTPNFNPGNAIAQDIETRDKTGDTLSAYIKGNFRKGPFAIDFAANHSTSKSNYEDVSNGHFAGLDLTASAGRVDFYGIDRAAPSRMDAYDNSGAPLDYSRLANWSINDGAVVKTGDIFSKDKLTDLKLDLRTELDFMPFYTAIKVGGSRKLKDIAKWGEGTSKKMRYTGTALTAVQVLDEGYTTEGGVYGTVNPQQWASTYKLYDIYKANPSLFNENYIDPVGTTNYAAENYTGRIQTRKGLKETTDSAYVMLENKFFRNRLSLVTGTRQSRKSIEGEQPYFNPDYEYVLNPDGTVYRDDIYTRGVFYNNRTGQRKTVAGGTVFENYAANTVLTDTALRARMQAAGITPPTQLAAAANGAQGNFNNNLALAKARASTRQIDRSRKDPHSPQVQVAYDVTKNLKARVAWSRETKLQNIEAAGTGAALAGSTTFQINEADNPVEAPGGYGTIAISNPGLAPEITNSWNLQLTYHTNSGGKVAVSYFRKLKENLWETSVIFDDDPEYASILSSFGIDPALYRYYAMTTTQNTALKAKSKGIEVDINQNLGFLHPWAKAFDMFATYSHRPGSASDQPASPILGWMAKLPTRDKYTGGLSFSAQRFSLQARVIYMEGGISSRNSTVTINPTTGEPANAAAGGVPVQIYNVVHHNLRLNLEANVRLSRRYSAFVQASDVLNGKTYGTRRYDAITGIQAPYSHNNSQSERGIVFNFGVSGSY